MLPRFFDTDQHLYEPPGFWDGRYPKKYAEKEPKFVRGPEKDGWTSDGGKTVRGVGGVGSVGGEDPRKIGPKKRLEDMDPGFWDPKKRIEVLDVDGVRATLLFGGGSSVTTEDEEFYLAHMRAYNDAVLDWAAEGDAQRIFPACYIPAIGTEHAMAELERCAKKGFIHYAFNQWPSGEFIPTTADDPFWALCQETGMTVSFHGFGMGRGKLPNGVKPFPFRLPSQEQIAAVRGAGLGATAPLAALLMNGVLERFPKLKFALIETSVGWLPTFAERMDAIYLEQRWVGGSTLKELPSESAKRMKISFDREWLGVKYRDFVGVDNIMFGTDFPHIGSFYPHSRFYLELVMQGVPAEEQEKMLWSNAANFYGVK